MAVYRTMVTVIYVKAVTSILSVKHPVLHIVMVHARKFQETVLVKLVCMVHIVMKHVQQTVRQADVRNQMGNASVNLATKQAVKLVSNNSLKLNAISPDLSLLFDAHQQPHDYRM